MRTRFWKTLFPLFKLVEISNRRPWPQVTFVKAKESTWFSTERAPNTRLCGGHVTMFLPLGVGVQPMRAFRIAEALEVLPTLFKIQLIVPQFSY